MPVLFMVENTTDMAARVQGSEAHNRPGTPAGAVRCAGIVYVSSEI